MIEGPVEGRPWALFTMTPTDRAWSRYSTFKEPDNAVKELGPKLLLKGYTVKVENQFTKEIVYEAKPHPDPDVRRQLREEAAMRELLGDDLTETLLPAGPAPTCEMCGSEDHLLGECLL